MKQTEQMNIVIVGHVDHGKSTIIGRLLADTNSLPKGKLESIREKCKKESKEFEYAFLLDALQNEQEQGITIDSARVFFKTQKRNYIIIDAPGHIEFLKNMISGASRAESALLVIDANEGIKENTKRHAYMLSMLGIKQVVVLVNKMDLVNYSEEIFNKIHSDFTMFLNNLNIKPISFIPVSGRDGINISSKSLPWYKGKNVLETLDSLKKENLPMDKPARMFIQDIYKFTKGDDDRRIIAGKISSGFFSVGDKVVFLPSGKVSEIKTIEEFNAKKKYKAFAGKSTGFTLTEQIYIKKGELMCKANELNPETNLIFESSIFWMGKKPLVLKKEYLFKIGSLKIPVEIKEITEVINASNLQKKNNNKVERHEVARCKIKALKPVVYDLTSNIQETSRFVLVDDYNISGGGIITNTCLEKIQKEILEKVISREDKWVHSLIQKNKREERFAQRSLLVLITGETGKDKVSIAKQLEFDLFNRGRMPYFIGMRNVLYGLDSDIGKPERTEHIRRLGEISHMLIEAGLLVIATASDLVEQEIQIIKKIVNNDIVVITLDNEIESSDLNILEDEFTNNSNKIIEYLINKKVIFGL